MQSVRRTTRNGSTARLNALHRWYEARSGGLQSAPAAWEVLAVHALYLLSGSVVVAAVLALTSSGEPIGSNAFRGVALMAAVCTVHMVWTVLRRTPPAETWFVSHLVWLSLTWGIVALVIAASLLVLGLALIAAVLLPMLVFLFYTPVFFAWACATWFLWRVGRGYFLLLRRSPIGSFGGARSRIAG
jgi:hypothetical protein